MILLQLTIQFVVTETYSQKLVDILTFVFLLHNSLVILRFIYLAYSELSQLDKGCNVGLLHGLSSVSLKSGVPNLWAIAH